MTPEYEIRKRVSDVGFSLSESIRAVLQDLPRPAHKTNDLCQLLGINKSSSSRVLRAIDAKNPISTMYLLPGPEALNGIAKAAHKVNVKDELVMKLRSDVERFDSLISEVAGDRGHLDTIIGAWLPEVREKTEFLNRQSVYKGMCQIKGFSKDLDISAHFVHPSGCGANQDVAILASAHGLKRLRPGVTISEIDNSFGADAGNEVLRTLDGVPVSNYASVMIHDFCSIPRPEFDVQNFDDALTRFTLTGEDVGIQSSIDLSWAYVSQNVTSRGFGQEIATPTKKIIFNILLHKDVPQDDQLALRVYDTAGKGLVAEFDDPTRASDLLAPGTKIQNLGVDASKHHCSDAPNYISMILHVCNKLGWNPLDFNCHRCTIDYPIYGSQILIRHYSG